MQDKVAEQKTESCCSESTTRRLRVNGIKRENK